jgi:hypothetical protein
MPCVVDFSASDQLSHAIATYQTHGWWSTDFYVFEPNFGEFLCKGHKDCGDLLTFIRSVAEYNNPNKATIQAVHL